jgi:hypothetical protein
LEGDGSAREFIVWHQQEQIKRLPIKGLRKTVLPWSDYLTQVSQEAQTQWKRSQAARR